ncbi:MAG: acyl-CoA thioesterase [Bacteroidales bacterium]|nr:acyl-CoA thioesterase [Bacteroidales bacterium]MBN2757194.1 acyl-CoA thioesterase [Bacteroidales bacterium]
MEINIKDFKHVIDIKLRYDDLDTYGHVNNKAYLSFLEEARIDYHKSVFKWKSALEFSSVVAKIEINYLKPVFYNDKLSAYTKLSNIGNKSFELTTIFVVNNENESDKIVSHSKVILVSIDQKTGLPNQITDEEKEKILEFERKTD